MKKRHTALFNHPFQRERTQINFPVLFLLFCCFLLGSMLGCIVGRGANTSSEIEVALSGNITIGFSHFLGKLWTMGKYHIVTLLAATSVIGVFIIPLVSFFRGYFLSCTVAAVVAIMPEHRFLTALVVCGIGALITVPSLFLLELDGFSLSTRLRSISTGKSYYYPNGDFSYHIGICIICILTAAAVECVLVPLLLSKIIH